MKYTAFSIVFKKRFKLFFTLLINIFICFSSYSQISHGGSQSINLDGSSNSIKSTIRNTPFAKITFDSLYRVDSFYIRKLGMYFDSIYTEIKASIDKPDKLEIEYYFFKSYFSYGSYTDSVNDSFMENSCDSIVYKFKDSTNFKNYINIFLLGEFCNSKKISNDIYVQRNWMRKSTYTFSLRWFYSSAMMKIDRTPQKPYYATISFVFSPYLTRRNWKKLAR